MFFFEKAFFLGLGDGENCSPKIFEKFEGGILVYFINKFDMFAPKLLILSKATQLKIINLT